MKKRTMFHSGQTVEPQSAPGSAEVADGASAGDPAEGLGTSEPLGWEGVAALTGGIPPEQVEELRAVRSFEAVYPLLHALTGRSLRDFFIRAAALEALVAADRPTFAARDVAEVLYFLDEPSRDTTMRSLRASGWLEHDPSSGTCITNAGRWAYDILAFLHKKLGEAELLPTVAGLDYALQIGVDPLRHILSMRSRLVSLRAEIDAARASHSEVVLRRTASRIDDALSLSARIRTILDRIPLDAAAARGTAREVHDLLSQLHGAGSELHRDVVEVGRQYLALSGGLTAEQIVRALMRRSLEQLAGVGRESLLPVLKPPPLLTTEVVASAAVQQALRERPERESVVWEEPPEAPRISGGEDAAGEAVTLLADLARLVKEDRTTLLSEIVPRDTCSESFLRLSLLALAGDTRAGEGFAGRLGALPLEVSADGDGWPEKIDGKPIKGLTPGAVGPRSGAGERNG